MKSDLHDAKMDLIALQKKESELRDRFVEMRTKAARVEGLDSKVQDLQFQLVRAENERDNARAKLAPFEIRAAQLYTNELPTEQLNELFKDFSPTSLKYLLTELS